MRFLIDEGLHESLVGVAHAAGFEATHVNHLGLSGQPDRAVAERIVKDEFPLHSGLIVLVPNVVPSVQRALFEAAAQYLEGRDLINAVIEVTREGKVVKCVEYQFPAE